MTACLGVIYLVDQTRSQFKMKHQYFDGKNRNGKREVPKVMTALKRKFDCVYPDTAKQARVHQFNWAGRLDLYAFVVEKTQ